MTPSKYLQSFLFALTAMLLITSCQGSNEPPVIKPTTSHQSTNEKKVVVPPEVAAAWKAVKIAVIDKSRATENIYTVPINGLYQIPSSSLTISIEAFLPSFVKEGSIMTSSSNELRNPGVKVNISDNGSIVFHGWLFTNFPNTHAFMHPKFSFALVGAVPTTK